MDSKVFVLVITAAILHAVWNFAARKASGNLGVMWFGLIVTSVGCFPFAIDIGPTGESLRSAWPFMVATGVIHAFYFGLLSNSYKEGEISIVYPIARGSGVAGTAIAAPIFIGEEILPVGVMGITAIALGILALGFQGHDLKKQFRSVISAFLVGCTIVGYSLVDKVGVGRIHPVVYVFSLFFLSAFFLSPYILLTCGKACVNVWKNMKRYIFLIGPGSMVTYLIILFALQSGKVSYIVAAREFAVVIGSALGMTFLAERFTWRKCLGISAITVGLVLVKLTK